MATSDRRGENDEMIVEVCEPHPLTSEEKSALSPCLKQRGLSLDMLDIINNIPGRTSIVKIKSSKGDLLGLTSVILTPSSFMKHCFGQGNHIGTNNTIFFAVEAQKDRVLSSMFRKLIELRPSGLYIGIIDDDTAGAFRSALDEVPHVVADKIMEAGSISTEAPGAEQALLKEHRHLSRQIHRFGNRGGTVHLHEGPARNGLADDFVACCLDSYRKNTHPGMPINVDAYGDHVRNFIMTFPSALYIYAKLDGRVTGVQIFIRHDRHLELTEGGFLSQTYHAYENIILASVRYAAEHKLDRVSYGLILNQPKDRLMDKDTRKPVFLVRFFREAIDQASIDDFRYKSHESFPMLHWKERSSFRDLPI